MTQKYDIINSDGIAINIIEWDGVSDWNPPDGCTVVEHDPANWGMVENSVEVVRTWLETDIRNQLSMEDKISWDNGTIPELVTIRKEFSYPRNLEDTIALLDFLISKNVISEEVKLKILE